MDRLESIKFEIQNTASDYIDDTFSFLNECIPMAKNASDTLKDYTPLLSTSTANTLTKVKNFDMETNAKLIAETKEIIAKLDADIQRSVEQFNQKCSYTKVHLGVVSKDITQFKAMLKNNISDIDSLDHQGRSPLFLAVITGHFDTAKALIEAGADVNQCGHENKSPLFIATALGRADLVQLLIDKKAKENLADLHGLTPLHITSFIGNTEILDILLESKAKVNQADVRGRTGLQLAAIANQSLVLQRLLDKNASTSHQDKAGRTALHHGLLSQSSECVDILTPVSKLDVKDKQGRDALFYASLVEDQKSVEALLKLGVLRDNADSNGLSALTIANKLNNKKIQQLIRS